MCPDSAVGPAPLDRPLGPALKIRKPLPVAPIEASEPVAQDGEVVAGDPQRDGSPQRVQDGLAALAIRGHRRPVDQVPVHRDAQDRLQVDAADPVDPASQEAGPVPRRPTLRRDDADAYDGSVTSSRGRSGVLR
jgi:hypothetical protein